MDNYRLLNMIEESKTKVDFHMRKYDISENELIKLLNYVYLKGIECAACGVMSTPWYHLDENGKITYGANTQKNDPLYYWKDLKQMFVELGMPEKEL